MNIGNLAIINSAANTATAITRAKLISLKPFLMTRFQQKQHEHERKCDQKKNDTRIVRKTYSKCLTFYIQGIIFLFGTK